MVKRILGVPQSDLFALILLAIWRLAIAAHHGLGADEAHYALYGLRLDWSYFDHPPLVGWVNGAFLTFFGPFVSSEIAVRLPAILSGLVCSIQVYNLSRRQGASDAHSRWAVVALNTMFIPAALWIMNLPDTLLLVLTFWLVDIGLNLAERPRFRDWMALGLNLGLCALAKYTAIFFVGSLLIFCQWQGLWKQIKPTGLFVAAVIALAISSPVFLWNQAHNWISFTYQSNHVMGGADFHLDQLGTWLATQLVAYNPLLVIAALVMWWKERKHLTALHRLILCLAIPSFLFFAYSSVHELGLPHWTLSTWCLVVPFGFAFGLQRGSERMQKILKSLAVVAVILVALLQVELVAKAIPFPDYQSPYADLTGWPEMKTDLQRLTAGEPAQSFAIGVTNWSLGSRANWYLSSVAPVYVMDDRFDQFDLWEGGPPREPNLLILEWRGFGFDEKIKSGCGSYDFVEEKKFLDHGHIVNSLKIYWCRGFRPPQ